MNEILKYLKNSGERLDSEIAAATGMSLASARANMSQLHAKGEIMVCRSIRYKDGKPIEAMVGRISGYIPPAAPGRKSKAQTKGI